MKKILLYIFLFLAVLPLRAQEKEKPDTDLLERIRNMSLKEILDMKISVASQTPLSMREAPGIVTLITREEILNSGSRDLIDVLNLLVPGFSFMQSEFGPIGAGVRGIWAYEGKVLLLIDGMEANDEGFAGILFGNHFSVENIERIEIIRGPGSVIYGGYAGLGVINIITRGAEEIMGVYGAGLYSRMVETFSHRNAAFGIGNKIDEFSFSLTGNAGEGKISDRKFAPYFYSESISGSQVRLDPLNLNLNLKYNSFDFRALYERYNMVYEIPYNFDSYNVQLKYDKEIYEDLSISAKLYRKWQNPWQLKAYERYEIDGVVYDTAYANNKITERNTGSLALQWSFAKDFHLLAGSEVYRSMVKAEPEEGYAEVPFGDGSTNSLSFKGAVLYSQFLYASRYGNFTLGGRYEVTDDFGDYFVPRFALTKLFDKFHFKLMFSKSFRIPGGKYYNTNLKPEKGINYEVELGYRLNRNHFFNINLYDIQYRDVIAVKRDSSDIHNSYYSNSDEIGTRGLEMEYKLVTDRVRLGSNFSWYTIYENSIDEYKIDNNREDKVLGFPSYKLNLWLSLDVSDNVSINPSVTRFGERFGYIEGIRSGSGVIEWNALKRFEPTTILNLNFRTTDMLVKGLQFDLGIMNILNVNFEYLQPFRGYRSPTPAPSSALVLRLYYETNFSI